MKKIIGLGFFVLMSAMVSAQTATVSGTVTDDQGKTIPFAFIKDSQHNYATFSDPNGAFTLNVDPASRLIVSCASYQGTVVPISGQSDVKVVLKAGATGDAKAKSTDAFEVKEQSNVEKWTRPLAQFGTAREELHGSPYFFNEWVHGYALSANDSLKENDNYLFNYQKIDGALLYTKDGKTMNMLDKTQAEKFYLFDSNGQQFSFEFVPSIDNRHYLQIVGKGSKYAIYKNLNTKFEKADFQTNGITTTGNNYDSYVDDANYYLVKVPGGQPQKFTLKKRAIKTAFGADAAKADKYFSEHDGDIDDNYLKGLSDYMNQ